MKKNGFILAYADVSPAFWGEGIDACLIDLISKYNPEIEKIFLMVARARTQEYPFYEELGFTSSDLTYQDLSPYFFKAYEKTVR
jgi:hypothetical protein